MALNLIVVFSGDSIVSRALSWAYQALGVTSVGDNSAPATMGQCTYVSANILMRNMGIAGTRLAVGTNNLNALAPTWMDPIPAVKLAAGLTPRRYLYICAIGTNDGAIGDGTVIASTVAAYAAAIGASAQARRTAGYDKLVLCTLLPRGDGAMTEGNRIAFNSTITGSTFKSTWGIDDVIDLAGDSIMGDPANLPVNGGGTTWYGADNIHPTTAGNTRLAPIAAAIINGYAS